jgi:hypothetical protein
MSRTASVFAALALAASSAAFAEQLTFSFADPIADSTFHIDVTNMTVVFDTVTGDFKITLTSTTAQPFYGAFRFNSNLFNQARLPNHSLFQSAGNDYALTAPKTKLIVTGANPHVQFWAAGDTVATNTLGSGGVNPPGSTLYRTAVASLPLQPAFQSEDTIAWGPTGNTVIAPLSGAGAASGIMDDVQVLIEAGVISGGHANALMQKLTNALASINNGKTNAACGQLGAFINQVNDLAAQGLLSPTQAAALVAAANNAKSLVPCS